MNVRNIEYFLVAAEEMNLSRAARRLYISQQALSTHIQRLEKEFDVQLFERRPTLRLTLEGEKMLFYGKQILNAEANLHAAFSDISKERRAKLRVGFSALRSEIFLPLIFQKYHSEWPNISVEVFIGNTDRSEDLLQAGEIDLYLGVEVSAKRNETVRKVAEEKFVCCFSRALVEQYRGERTKEFLERCRNGVLLEDIIDMPIVTGRKDSSQRRVVDQHLARLQLQPNIVVEVNQQRTLYSLAKGGSGIGLLSPVELYAHLQELQWLRGEFFVFPLSDTMPTTSVFTVCRNDNPLPNYALSFLRVTEEVLHNYTASLSQETTSVL